MEEVHNPSRIYDQPLTIASYPRAIVHIDGDAFFASCEQARDPVLQGRSAAGDRRLLAPKVSPLQPESQLAYNAEPLPSQHLELCDFRYTLPC